MSLNDTGKNALLTGGLGNAVTFLSLHTGDPSTTGANEATGGSPPYARKGVAWAAASAGLRASSSAQLFDVAAGTYYFVGMWDAVTAGNFYGYLPAGNFTMAVGTAANTGDVITSYAHGLTNGQNVVVFNVQGGAIPGGLTEGTVYFVVGAATDTFQVSLTSGGAAVAITTDSEVGFQRLTPETFAAQGQVSLAIGAVVLDATVV